MKNWVNWENEGYYRILRKAKIGKMAIGSIGKKRLVAEFKKKKKKKKYIYIYIFKLKSGEWHTWVNWDNEDYHRILRTG